jgi:hypothetical protein
MHVTPSSTCSGPTAAGNCNATTAARLSAVLRRKSCAADTCACAEMDDLVRLRMCRAVSTAQRYLYCEGLSCMHQAVRQDTLHPGAAHARQCIPPTIECCCPLPLQEMARCDSWALLWAWLPAAGRRALVLPRKGVVGHLPTGLHCSIALDMAPEPW